MNENRSYENYSYLKYNKIILIDKNIIQKSIFDKNISHMDCQKSCYEASLAACEETIVLTGLTASHTYYWLLTSRNNKIYQRQATTDIDGNLTIDTTILPPGSFSKYAIIKLELREGDNYLTKVQFSFDGVAYSCIQLSFYEADGDIEGTNIIGMNQLETVPGAIITTDDITESADKKFIPTDDLAFLQQLKADYTS